MENSSDKLSRMPPNILRNSVQERIQESDNFLHSIERANARVSEIPKDELLKEIMCRLENQALGKGSLISLEEIDAIGLALIENYCDLETTAQELNMPIQRLKFLIRELDELQVYYEIAQEGIKSLTDKQVIQNLKKGDPDTVKRVFNKLYAGRSKGGFNAAEIGTTGYKDKLGKRLADETLDDRKSNKVEVQFNFIKKEVRTEFEKVAIDGEVIEENIKDADESEGE
jgi:hypothetical protein